MRLERFDYTSKIGDFLFSGEEDSGIWIIIPNDVGRIRIPLKGPGAWQWDGNREEPTLSPSIQVYPSAGFHDGWHGWMRKGKLVT